LQAERVKEARMKVKLCFSLLIVFFIIAVLPLNTPAEQEEKQMTQEPNIEGTYKLISRKLPDGTMQGPPDIMGLLTYTKSYRNFNVVWKDDKGKFFSFSYAATYKLTATEYSEMSMFSIINDQISGKEINYDLSSQTGSSPVTVEDGRIKFKLPLFNEPALVFEGDRMTATAPGKFVDVWEKVQ
jgi:hypothetical protein